MKLNKIFSFLLALVVCFSMQFNLTSTVFAEGEEQPAVAKVGETSYTTIEEAVANWGNNTTLTLLADVELSSTIIVPSNEYRVLDLSTFTLTSTSTTAAIEIENKGRTSASYTLDIKADANNPGGINATKKYVIKTTGKSGVQDRPIIRFYGGIFNSYSHVIYHSGSNGTKCPQFWIYGGTFNKSIYANRALFQIYGGTFEGMLQISVDSSAYMAVSGGRFKSFSNSYGSALNTDKFVVGTSKGNFNRDIVVDDEGYYNIVPIGTVDMSEVEAVAKANYNSNNYFAYSNAATVGMYYNDAQMALADSNNKNAQITFYNTSEAVEISNAFTTDLTVDGSVLPASEITLKSSSSKMTVVFAEGEDLSANVKSGNVDYDVVYSDVANSEAGTITRTYSMQMKPYVAKSGTKSYTSLQRAYDSVAAGSTITLIADIEDAGMVIEKDITIDLGGHTYNIDKGAQRSLTAGLQLAEGVNVTIKNGTITGSGADVLIENYANLTIEDVELDGSNAMYALSNRAGETVIKDSAIIASEDGVAFEIRETEGSAPANVTVENSNISGEIELVSASDDSFTGSLSIGNTTHTVAGSYMQTTESIEILDAYTFNMQLSANAIQANDSITVEISLDKAFYSAEYTFAYDKTKFACADDEDGDGYIYEYKFEKAAGEVLATYTLVAKNDITEVTNTDISVEGNVLQYHEQSITSITNPVSGETETVTISLDYSYEIHAEYVSGYTLVLVRSGNSEDAGYAYNGTKMFYVEGASYEAYAILVYGAVTAENIDAALSKTTGCDIVTKSYDVNCEYVTDGVVDLKDATAIYACSSLDFDVNTYMELFLRADVDNNFTVEVADINAVTSSSNYVK